MGLASFICSLFFPQKELLHSSVSKEEKRKKKKKTSQNPACEKFSKIVEPLHVSIRYGFFCVLISKESVYQYTCVHVQKLFFFFFEWFHLWSAIKRWKKCYTNYFLYCLLILFSFLIFLLGLRKFPLRFVSFESVVVVVLFFFFSFCFTFHLFNFF